MIADYGLRITDLLLLADFIRFLKTNADVSPQLYRYIVGIARGEA